MNDTTSGGPVVSIEVTPRPVETARIIGTDLKVRRPKDQIAMDFQSRISELKPVIDASKKGVDLGSVEDARKIFAFIWAYLREILVSGDDYMLLRKRLYGQISDDMASDSVVPVPGDAAVPADPDDDLEIKHVIEFVVALHSYWEQQTS